MNIMRKFFEIFRNDNYDEAMRLYNTHLYREAIDKFELVIKKKASGASLYRNLAQFYCCYAHRNIGIMLFVVGNFSCALREFEQSLACCKNPQEVYHLMGICQNNLGEFENAVRTFSAILKSDPDSVPTKLRLGIALHNLKMWDKSVSLYSTILSQKPKYADVHFRLGLAYLGQNRADLAVEAFRSAVRINPNYVEAHIKLGLTQAYVGDSRGALESFDSILGRHPDFADIYYARGIVLASSGSIEDARASFEKALEINPTYKDAQIKLGILHCSIGEYEIAAACLRGAGRIDPQDASLQLAIEAVTSIMASPAGMKNIPLELTRFFGGGKPIDEAIRQFNANLKINPDLSAVLAIIKEFSEEDTTLCEMLLPVVRDYMRDQPGYPDTHNTLGSIYLKLSRFARAEECFREALRLNPDYLKARVNLFNTLRVKSSCISEAIEQGEFIISKNVDYPDVYCHMGELLMMLGRYDEALVHLEKSLKMRPHYGKAHFFKARIFAARERCAEAEQAFEACLATYPPADIGNAAREALNALRQKR